MPKPLIAGPNYGFVTWSPGPKGRLGIIRLGKTVAGSAFTNPGHMFRLARESDLTGFLAQRIEVTVAKFQYAMAQCFAQSERYPLLIVEGARVQHGQGHSSLRIEGGKSFLSGTEAAHLGIGTITQQGEAVSVKAAHDLVLLAGSATIARRDIPTSFEASGQLISYGLAQDALTYYAPAMVNRVEGLLEAPKQRLLLGVLPPWIPRDPSALELAMNATGVRIAELMVSNRAAIAPILQRLDQLKNNLAAREFLQDPLDPDPGNKLFGGEESKLLEAEKEAFGQSTSSLQSEVERIIQRVPERTQELVERAVVSLDEQSAAKGEDV
jgi:hypothetical protein